MLKDKILKKTQIDDYIHFDTIDSTNTYLKDLSKNEFLNNRLVLADQQSAGRGRMHKTFYSPKNGLYFSFVIKPDLALDEIQLLTINMALAVHRSLKSLYNIQSEIKWLNDIYIENRKVCGILAEGVISSKGTYDFIVIGVGINLVSDSFVPDELKDIYTALSEHHHEINRDDLLIEILNEFYSILDDDRSDLISEYKKECLTLNKKVVHNHKVYKAIDINNYGHLLVEDEHKIIHELNSGEVSLEYEN